MQEHAFDTFQVRADVEESPPRVRVQGEIAIHEHDDALTEVFRKLHEELLSVGATEVRVDLREAKYASSRAIRAFIKWILWLDAKQPAYCLVFECDPASAWQSANTPIFAKLSPRAVQLAEAT